MLLRYRPLDRWPRDLTPDSERRWSPFRRSGYGTGRAEIPLDQTLDDLDRELSLLRVEECVVQLAVAERDVRLGGDLRGDARPKHPGVIVTFTAPGQGPLTFACDAFRGWEANLRAIAKGLEALRLLDRYGITSTGEQYAGWKELPSGVPLGSRADDRMGVDEAARIVVGWVSGAHDLAQNARTAIDDADFRRYAYRQALKHLHPDAGGDDSEAFLRLQRAAKILEENDG